MPGLSTVTTDPGRNEIVFRGVSTGAGEWRLDSGSAVYLGAIPMTSATQAIDPRTVDLSSIEALPGPQGTRYGSSSQSGALVYIPNKPDHSVREAEIKIAGTHMEEGESGHTFEAWANIPIVEDKLTLRAVAYDVETGGYIDNVYGQNIFSDDDNADVVEDDFNTWSQKGFRVSALWSVNENWDAEFMYIKQRSHSQGDIKSDPNTPGLDDFDIVRFFKDDRKDNWWLGSVTVTGDLGFAEFSYAGSVVSRDITYEKDGNIEAQIRHQRALEGDFYGYNIWYQTGFRPEIAVNDQIADRTTHELRLTSMGDSRFQWMIGAFHEKTEDAWDYSYSRVEDLRTTPFGEYIWYWYDIAETDDWYAEQYSNKIEQTAVFGEMTYDLTEKLTLGAGMRWFEYDRDRHEELYWPVGITWSVDDFDGKEDDTLYMFDIKYALSEDINTYFHYSEGFRLGGKNSIRKPSSILPKDYGSDSLTNYEIGMKSEWLDNSLQLNVSYYMMDWEDIQRWVGDPTDWTTSGTINMGDAELSGLELTLKYQVTERLYIDATFNKSDSELKDDYYLRDLIPTDSNDLIGAKGQELAINPDTKYSLGVEYSLPGAFRNLDLWMRYDHWWQADMYHDWWNALNDASDCSCGTKLLDSQDEGSFRISISEDGNWDLTLSVWNIWDDRNAYWIDSGQDGDFGVNGRWPEIGRYVNMPGYSRPREFELSFTKKFEF